MLKKLFIPTAATFLYCVLGQSDMGGAADGPHGESAGGRWRGRDATPTGRAASFPGMTAVGGFFFDFGCVRTRCRSREARRGRGGERRPGAAGAGADRGARRRRRGAGLSEALEAFDGA